MNDNMLTVEIPKEDWDFIADSLYKIKQTRKYYERLEEIYTGKLRQLSNDKPTSNNKYEFKMVQKLWDLWWQKKTF